MDDMNRINALMTHPAFNAIALIRAVKRMDLDEIDRVYKEGDPYFIACWCAHLLEKALALHDDRLDDFLDYVTAEVFQQLDKRTCPDTADPGSG